MRDFKPEEEISALDWRIRQLTGRISNNQDMAEHFLERVAEDQEVLTRVTAERDAWLGNIGLGNVVPLTSLDGGGAA